MGPNSISQDMVSNEINIFMLCFFCDPYVPSSRLELIISNLIVREKMRKVSELTKFGNYIILGAAENRKNKTRIGLKDLILPIKDMLFFICIHAKCQIRNVTDIILQHFQVKLAFKNKKHMLATKEMHAHLLRASTSDSCNSQDRRPQCHGKSLLSQVCACKMIE